MQHGGLQARPLVTFAGNLGAIHCEVVCFANSSDLELHQSTQDHCCLFDNAALVKNGKGAFAQ